MTINKEITGSSSLGIYIHIPFCRQKCSYCDFVSFSVGAGAPDLQRSYIEALKREVALQADLWAEKRQVDTIYIGGGTPTTLEPGLIGEVLEEIFRRFSVVGPDRLEMTIEANPESVDTLSCRRLKAMGFNRASLGVQSLNDQVLRSLGRIHDSRCAAESFYRIREIVTDNVNVDVMFGLPEQTTEIWTKTVEQLLLWQPSHVSFYSLQLEEGTLLYNLYRDRKLELPSWACNRAMYHTALELLKQADYEHYEVSSAALPGRRCRHNLKYWSMQEYLGLGLSAHSYLEGVRYENTPALDRYIAGDDLLSADPGSRADRIGDYLFTELRRIEGFEFSDFVRYFGTDFRALYDAPAAALIREGLLLSDGVSLRLSPEGLDQTNIVLGRLLNDERVDDGQ